MIAEFNRGQVVRGAFGLAGSVACYVLAWLFFRYGATMALHVFGYPTGSAPWIALAAVGGVTFSGWQTWKNGEGLQSYSESALCHDFGGTDTVGSYLADQYVGRVTGPAYVLSQVFLGGPLLMLRSLHRIRTRVPEEAGLEQKLAHLLTVLHAVNKWQGLENYPGQEREVLLLNLMKKIDFSQHKGNVRFKARSSDGI